MQWSPAPGAGFTQPDVRPWLPFGDYRGRNVADEAQDPSSMLSLCRGLLELRHRHLGPGVVTYEEIPAPEEQWVYRTGNLIVIANFSDEMTTAAGADGDVLLSTFEPQGTGEGSGLQLRPWEGVIMKGG
jgi:glycosidase